MAVQKKLLHHRQFRRVKRRICTAILLSLILLYLCSYSGSIAIGNEKPGNRNRVSMESPVGMPTWLVETRFLNSFVETRNFASLQLARGQQLYQLGQFQPAVEVWQQAAIAYENQGQPVERALALSYLALAYQELGDFSLADENISESLQLLGYSSESDLTPPFEGGVGGDAPPFEGGVGGDRQQAILAKVLNTQGSLQFTRGQIEAALSTWEIAADVYDLCGDPIGAIATEINQAKALQMLGLYRRSQQTLERVQDRLQQQPNDPLKAQALVNLGNVLRLVGALEKSQQVLTESLAVAEIARSPADIGAALLNLGNTARANGDLTAAKSWYQQAEAVAVCGETESNCWLQLQAKLNQFSLLVATDLTQPEQWSEVLELFAELSTALMDLPLSQMAVYGQIELANNAIAIGEKQKQQEPGNRNRVSMESPVGSPTWPFEPGNRNRVSMESPVGSPTWSFETRFLNFTAAQLLATAVQSASKLANLRAESVALGTLGYLYTQTGQLAAARQLNEQALALAMAIDAPDIAYRWQWQLGRLLKQQNPPDIPGAIAFYTQAVKTLDLVKRDLVAIDAQVQFSFQSIVEPVYRELVELLLPPAKKSGVLEPAANQANISQALQAIESLYLAELENYFREPCVSDNPVQIDQIDRTAAVIYPIILPDRLETIVSLPGMPLQHSTIFETQETIENTARQMRNSLRKTSFLQERLPLAEQLYDWLIRPVAKDLADRQIETLVFVLDGAFRNLPMAALYDGQQYLVEKYAIALSSSLQLLESQTLQPSEFQGLIGGLSAASQGFKPLPAVELELAEIAAHIPTRTLLDRDFTRQNLQEAISKTSFEIVHLATHAQFSSNPEQTFILTWDDKIKVKDLQTILRDRQLQPSPIELLVLSACQTAEGDKRAILGLAGIALRSGARSTLATLWAVNDESTAAFMAEFYRQLTQPDVTKAEAQRLGQLKLLNNPKYRHPFYWAPFVLVGNWR